MFGLCVVCLFLREKDYNVGESVEKDFGIWKEEKKMIKIYYVKIFKNTFLKSRKTQVQSQPYAYLSLFGDLYTILYM